MNKGGFATGEDRRGRKRKVGGCAWGLWLASVLWRRRQRKKGGSGKQIFLVGSRYGYCFRKFSTKHLKGWMKV